MPRLRTTVVRWESDDFPGWLELVVIDAAGREHRIVEKAPVLTDLPITSATPFPMDLWIDASAGSVEGEELVVSLGHGVETVDGLTELTMARVDVTDL